MTTPRYGSISPAISRFNAGVQMGDQQRAAEEQAFEQRRQREQALGVDKALREGIGAIYAGQPPAGVPKPPATVTPPVPVLPPQTESAVIQAQAGGPVDTAPPVAMPEPAAPAGPQPVSMPEVTAPAGSTPPVPMPSVSGPAAPAGSAKPGIASFSAGDPTRALMSRLAQTPGAGTAMMQEHGHEQTRQTQRATADRLVGTQQLNAQNQGWTHLNKALDDFDVDRARQISTQYQLGIPDAAWTNMKFRTSMLLGSKLAKDMFKLEDEHRPQFLHAFMKEIGAGKDEHSAAVTAYAEVSAPPPGGGEGRTGAKRMVKDASGAYVWVYEGGGSRKTDVRGSAPGARSGGGGAGGAGGKQQQYAQWRIKTLTDAGIPANEASKIVAGGAKQVTERDVTNLAARLLQLKDRAFKPVYPDLQAAATAAREAYGMQDPTGGGTSPAPTRARGGAAPVAEPRRRFDADGNEIIRQ